VERVEVRAREPGAEEFENYAALYRARREFVEAQYTKPVVIKAPKPGDFEVCPQGVAHWYMNPDLRPKEHALPDWYAFMADIEGVTGRHRHQGGLIIFVVEGEGYTTMNGVRFDWKAGDMMILPLLPEAVEHQHFNLRKDGNSKWLAFIHVPTWNDVGSEVTQVALDPRWVAKTAITSWDGAAPATEKVEARGEAGKA
jgi:quercetin dioxygenase-like cupin family protein